MGSNNSRDSFKTNKVTNDSELGGHIDKLYREAQNKVRPQHYSWLLQLAYIAGDQYKTFDTANFRVRELSKAYGYEEREVFNKMRTIRNTYYARITQNKPVPWAEPRTLKDRDKRRAKVTNAIIKDVWEKNSMDDKYEQLGLYCADYGGGFIKTVWDNSLGKKLISKVDVLLDEVENSNFLDDNYRTKLKRGLLYKKDIFEGDVNTSILSPFEVYTDNPTRRNIEESPWIMHVRAFPKDVAEKVYVLDLSNYEEEPTNSITLQSGSMSYGIGYSSTSYGYRTNMLEDVVSVKEYYERPTNEFPDGRFIIVVGKTVVHYGTLPYQIGDNKKREIPIIRVQATPETGNFYGATPMSDLRPIQRRYNAVRNRTAEALNRKAVGQWIAYEDSIHRQSRLTNKPGSVIIVKKNRPAPQRVNDNAQTGEFRMESGDLNQEFVQISGSMTIEGGVPSSIRSATQMSMLTEPEDNRIGITTKSMAEAIQTWAKYVIRLYQQFTVGKRFVKFHDGWEEGIEWDAEMIDDNIYIKNINYLALQPAQKQQMILDLTNLGVFHEQSPFGVNGTKNLLEALDFKFMDFEHLIPFKSDLDKANRENQRVMSLRAIAVDEYDNHAIHMNEHRNLIISEEWEQFIFGLAEMDPNRAEEIEILFRQHIGEHQEQIEIAQMQANAAQMMEQQ